jgi:hypothetical protein
MKWSVSFDPPLSLTETPMLLIEYRAVGVSGWRDYFVYTAPRQPSLPQPNYHAVWLDELVPDGKWRQIVAKLPEPAQKELATLAIQVQSEGKEAEVIIRRVKFVSRAPAPEGWLDDFLPQAPEQNGKWHPLDLTRLCNVNLGQIGLDLPVKEFRFRRKSLSAAGVPFTVSDRELNGIAADGEVGEIAVELPQLPKPSRPTEAYLLLAASFPPRDEPSYGWVRLWRIRHPHRFVVEVVYADGSSETYFPLRLISRRPEIARGLDVYVVPLRKLAKELRLHDRMRLGEFALCGLTLNLGKPNFYEAGEARGRASFWDVTPLPQAKMRPLAPPSKVAVERRPDAIVFQNANLRVRVQTHPPQLSELVLLPLKRNLLVQPAPLFEVRSWDEKSRATSADYKLANARTGENEIALDLLPPDERFPEVRLVLRMDGHATMQLGAVLRNRGKEVRRWKVHLPAHWQLRIGDGDFYAYPFRTVVISDAENDFRYRYGGSLPLQFLDLSNPQLGVGVGLMTKDLSGLDRNVDLRREGSVTAVGIRWRCDPLEAGKSFELPTVELFAHSGDWRQTFERYKEWVRSWYRPLAPRKDWFRKVFAFRQDYIYAGLFDFEARAYRFVERVQFAREAFGACDYLHIFDWGATLHRGRTGDYDPWGDRLTSADEFREAVTALQRGGVPVGLYMEGYLVDERSRIGKAHRQDWGLRNPDGSVQLWEPGHPEFVMCPGAKGWRDYLTSVYRRVWQETGALGFYIDQFGFCGRDCFATDHDHPPDWNVLRGEGLLTKQVREALPQECVVYTENFPPDIHTVLQDGSFDYAVYEFQASAHKWMDVPVRLGRFAFPDFKVLQIIVCDQPVGTNEEAVKQVFFNGDGFWLQGEPDNWWQQEALQVLRRCIAILREHADAFSSDDCEPLVPTLVAGVFANRFSSPRKTVWTLYNANYRSVSGEVLAVPHIDGARYFDAWNGKEIKPRVVGKTAYLPLTLEPHGVGCVVQER